MRSTLLKAALVTMLMICAAFVAQICTPTRKMADARENLDLSAMFPLAFDGWRVDKRLPAVLPAPDVQAKLDRIYNQTLSRTYINGDGQQIMLSVAYGGDQSDGTAAHKPEVCYPAQGFEVSAIGRHILDIDHRRFEVKQLVAKLGARVEPLTYWIVVGDEVVSSATQQKLAQIRRGMRGLIPDGLLVRVSSIDSDRAHAFSVQREFIRSLAIELKSSDRVAVFGRELVESGM